MTPFRPAISLLLTACVLAAGARADYGEPNDSCSNATTLTAGTHPGLRSHEHQDPPQFSSFDVDWYRIVVPPGQRIAVTLTRTASSGAPARLLARLYERTGSDCAGTIVAEVDDGGVLRALNDTGTEREYHVWAVATVLPQFGLGTIEYALRVELGAGDPCGAAPDDAFEAAPGVVVPLAPGAFPGLRVGAFDDDEFSLRLPAGTRIRARIDFVHANGDLDLTLRDGDATYASSGSGDHESILYETPALDRDVIVRVAPKPGFPDVCTGYALSIEVLQTLGTIYCVAGTNGHGTGARILGAGSSSVSANDLAFVCQAFPGANPGVLIASTTPAQAPFGDGFRCVGGSIVRLGSSAASDGVAEYRANLAAGAGLAIAPGATWNFQVFYRELSVPGGAGFNLSDALAVPMVP